MSNYNHAQSKKPARARYYNPGYSKKPARAKYYNPGESKKPARAKYYNHAQSKKPARAKYYNPGYSKKPARARYYSPGESKKLARARYYKVKKPARARYYNSLGEFLQYAKKLARARELQSKETRLGGILQHAGRVSTTCKETRLGGFLRPPGPKAQVFLQPWCPQVSRERRVRWGLHNGQGTGRRARLLKEHRPRTRIPSRRMRHGRRRIDVVQKPLNLVDPIRECVLLCGIASAILWLRVPARQSVRHVRRARYVDELEMKEEYRHDPPILRCGRSDVRIA